MSFLATIHDHSNPNNDEHRHKNDCHRNVATRMPGVIFHDILTLVGKYGVKLCNIGVFPRVTAIITSPSSVVT